MTAGKLSRMWVGLGVICMTAAAPADARPSLDQVLREALNQSHSVRIAEAQADKARFDRHIAYQTYLPNVRLESSYRSLDERIRFQLDPLSLPLPGTEGLDIHLPPITLQERHTFRASVEVSQVLFTGFKVPRLGQAARHGEQAALHKVEAGKQELLEEVAAAYDRLALIDQALEVLEKAEERLAEEQRVANKAYTEGLIPAYDLTRLRIADQDLKKERIDWIGKRELAARNLEHLTGISWQEFADGPEDGRPRALEILPVDDALPQSDRPEVRALQEVGKASRQQHRAAQSDYMPQVYAFFRQELYEDDLSVLEPARAVGVGLRWNLFDGFNRSRNVQKARRDYMIARERLEEVESLLALDRHRAEVSLSVAGQQLDVAHEIVNEAETALRLSTERYRLGLAPVSEKLEAETDYRRAEMGWLEAVYEQRRAAIGLLRAAGMMEIEHIVMLENKNTGGSL
ncbi:TolC family protein [Balneolales bacterium ANBcel1]|nr:TolC family protein [Balneolales bacterium ANBcel1]